MKTILLLSLVAVGTTAFAANGSYKVTLLQDSVIEGKNLKAGDYKISMENGNAVIKQGKVSVEVPAREEPVSDKVFSTSFKYSDGMTLQSVSVGGTHTRIVFEPASQMHSGM